MTHNTLIPIADPDDVQFVFLSTMVDAISQSRENNDWGSEEARAAAFLRCLKTYIKGNAESVDASVVYRCSFGWGILDVDIDGGGTLGGAVSTLSLKEGVYERCASILAVDHDLLEVEGRELYLMQAFFLTIANAEGSVKITEDGGAELLFNREKTRSTYKENLQAVYFDVMDKDFNDQNTSQYDC